MKKVLGLLAAFMIGIGSNFVEAANIKDFPRVAVMNFGNKAIMSRGLRAHDFSSASEYAIFQLANSGWFDLVDYEQLSTIAKMHSVNMSGLVDPATAVAMGKFAGAEFMVIGNVTGLTVKENTFGYQHGGKAGIGNAQHVVTANVAMRIVDIETGRIVAAGLGKGSSTSTHTELSFTKYRNRKVETEDISDTITKDVIDEYTKNKSSSKTSTSTRDKNTTLRKDKNKTTNTNNSKDIEDSYDESNDETITEDERELINSGSSTDESEETYKEAGTSYETIENTKGDVDYDGDIDEDDLELLKAFKVGKHRDGDDEFFNRHNADIDGDGDIDSTDVSLLTLHISGKQLLAAERGSLIPYEDSNTTITKGKNTNNSTEKEKTKGKTTNKKTAKGKKETSHSSVNTEETDSSGYEYTNNVNDTVEQNDSTDETYNKANNENRVTTTNKSIYYERETEDYVVTIGTVEVSDIQVRNAISKAVRDAVYGKTGLMTVLNGGKQLKIKTGF